MRRAVHTPPVPAKMFRHFAVITLAITFCVAIFADGENRQVIEDELAEREKSRALAMAEFDTFGSRKLGSKAMRNRTGGSFGADNDVGNSDFGGPMDDGGDYVAPPTFGEDGEEQQAFAGSEVVLLDGAGNPVDGGTARPAARPAPPSKPSPDDLQRILAASQARSGSAGED